MDNLVNYSQMLTFSISTKLYKWQLRTFQFGNLCIKSLKTNGSLAPESGALIHQSFWLHCTPVVFLLLNHTSTSNIISMNRRNFTRGRACFSFKTLIQWQMFWDSLVAKLNLDIHKFRFWNMMMNLGHSLPHSPSWHGWESSNTQGIFFRLPCASAHILLHS